MKKVFSMFVLIVAMVVTLSTTGCGITEDAKKAVNTASQTVKETADSAKETAGWWTRSTNNQSWVNDSGTRVTIKEDRRSGDFLITIEYKLDEYDESFWGDSVDPSDTVTTFRVKELSELLMEDLRRQ